MSALSAHTTRGSKRRRKRDVDGDGDENGDDGKAPMYGANDDDGGATDWPPPGSISSKLAMHGQLIDVTNHTLLAEVANHGIITRAKIGQYTYELSTKLGGGTENLKVALVKTTSNKFSKHRESVWTFVKELELHIAELETIEGKFQSLQRRIVKKGDADGAKCLGVTRMLMAMSQHNSRIEELQRLTTLPVEFEQETVEESMLLPPHKAVELGGLFEGTLVMWCPEQIRCVPRAMLREVRREVEVQSEEMSPVIRHVVKEWKGPDIDVWDVVVTGKGEDQLVLLTDDTHNQVHVLNRQNGAVKRSFGNKGLGPGQFHSPRGLAVLCDDRVAVVDNMNNRVSLWNADGTFLRHFGSRGAAAGHLEYPQGIAASAKHLIVADTNNHRVQVFDYEGMVVREMGKKGNATGLGQLNKPVKVAVGDGQVGVWCLASEVVSLFSEANGSFLRSIEFEGGGRDYRVSKMAIRRGMLYLIVKTASTERLKLQVFSLAGTFMRRCDLGVGGLNAINLHASDGNGEEGDDAGSVGAMSFPWAVGE